jgi:regulator of protease activity HflC (stomatin/prohibitin superfamily)
VPGSYASALLAPVPLLVKVPNACASARASRSPMREPPTRSRDGARGARCANPDTIVLCRDFGRERATTPVREETIAMRRKTASAGLLTLFLGISACVVIEDGEVGVTKSFGAISDEPVPQGVALVFPVVRVIETWNVKLQEHKERAQVPSSEGLIVGLDVSLLYQVVSSEAPELRKTVGNARAVNEQLVIPYLRNGVRDVVSGYPVKNIYSETGRKEIAERLRGYLVENLEDRGIKIVDVLLRDVQLPDKFRQSIEAKLTAEQRAEQKEFELTQAKKDAEIEVARAQGAAKAQTIIRETLSDSYLHYLWIRTLNENPNVIYVATEANLPIFKTVK